MLLFLACAAAPPTWEGPLPAAFPYSEWTAVLQQAVNAQGLVDYKGLQQDRRGIDHYTQLVAAVGPSSHPELFPHREDRLAWALNAYNAYAITGVIDRPGLKSVHQSKAMLAEFFYLSRYWMDQKKQSLGDFESWIRQEFQEPRVHFALNCDSIGCPRLPQQAFLPETLEAQLQAAAVEFCSSPAKVYLEGNTAHLSQIFEWYAQDFEGSGGVLAFINAHGGSLPSGVEISYIPYDWGLIAQAGREP